MDRDAIDTERLQRQLDFIIEVDKLKDVVRRSYLVNGQRKENTAEHSWHLTIMALVLAEHANEEINLLRVLKMLIVHDIVEIDADDTFFYDEAGHLTKADREQQAAERMFSLLPSDQGEELKQLWEEFEERSTPEAKFAAAIDRLMPLLHNYHNGGKTWAENAIISSQVLDRNSHMADGSEALWKFAQTLIKEAVEKKYLATTRPEANR